MGEVSVNIFLNFGHGSRLVKLVFVVEVVERTDFFQRAFIVCQDRFCGLYYAFQSGFLTLEHRLTLNNLRGRNAVDVYLRSYATSIK